MTRQALARCLVGLVCISCSLCSAAANETADTAALADRLASLPFDEFVDESYRELARLDPDSLWAWGVAGLYGIEDFSTWTTLSIDALAERAALASATLDLLRTYNRDHLTRPQKTAYEAYEWFLEDFVRSAGFPYWNYGIGASTYGVYNLAIELLMEHPIEAEEDARQVIRRVEGIDEWMQELIAVYEAREDDGVLPTESGVNMALAELDRMFPPESQGGCNPSSLDVYTHFVTRLNTIASIPPEAKAELRAALRQAIESHLIPAFRDLRDYIASLRGRGSCVGVSNYANADAYYEYLIGHHVTKPMTAEEIHAIGRTTVTQLRQELRDYAIHVLGWPSTMTMAEIDARIVEENQPILQGEALLAEYQSYVDEVRPRIDLYFNAQPTADVVITVERAGPPAYYREPPIDGTGPGEIVTSLVNIVPFTTYDEPVLMHHEGIPGHHFQSALARDLDLPDFQRDRISNIYARHPLFQAYTEGWALYAENLAAEMGVYEDDPFAGLCQKRLLLTRIARLVVDTGINAHGWTWNEATDYVREETGQTLASHRQLFHDAYPGQALGYNIMYLTLVDLRQRAMDALGDAFDIKAFHDTILLCGPVPLTVLEALVQEWITETLATS